MRLAGVFEGLDDLLRAVEDRGGDLREAWRRGVLAWAHGGHEGDLELSDNGSVAFQCYARSASARGDVFNRSFYLSPIRVSAASERQIMAACRCPPPLHDGAVALLALDDGSLRLCMDGEERVTHVWDDNRWKRMPP
jgi:hypothetical protein